MQIKSLGQSRMRRISRNPRVVIAGMGTAIPPRAISQRDAAAIAEQLVGPEAGLQRFVAKMYMNCGVRQRHSVLLGSSGDGHARVKQFYSHPSQAGNAGPTTADRMVQYHRHAGALAAQAAELAIGRSGLPSDRITHLVTVSCTGFGAPGVDCELMERLGLFPSVQRVHVGFMGCHGMLNALRVAQAFVEADPRSTVLVCAVELCTLHHQYGGDLQQIVANALFSDGAAAVVLRASAPGDAVLPHVGKSTSRVIPGTESHMTWRIGNHGFTMTLSPEVPSVLRQHLRPWVDEWLGACGRELKTVGSWAIHPGGPKILEVCADAIGFPLERLDPSREVLAELGNMSSPTVLFVVERLLQQGAPRPIVLMAFGPGLTLEAMLLH